MAYTPELSMESSRIIRRIAWSLDKPMTQTMEILVKNITMFIDRKKICSKCRDNSFCNECIFSDKNHKVCGKLIQ